MKFALRHSTGSSPVTIEAVLNDEKPQIHDEKPENRQERRQSETGTAQKMRRRPSLTKMGSLGSLCVMGAAGTGSAFSTANHQLSGNSLGRTSFEHSAPQVRSSNNPRTISKLGMDTEILSGAGSVIRESSVEQVPTLLDRFHQPSTLQSVIGLAFGLATKAADDPDVKSELFTDASHIMGDLASFAIQNKAALRFSVFTGRILSLIADYIPDHAIQTEELIFQGLMLGVSANLLKKSLEPLVAAHLTPISIKDKRAYLALFKQFGLSWTQFRSVKAVAADWVEVRPGEEVTGDARNNYLYWVQQGGVSDHSGTVQGKNVLGLVGVAEFASKLQAKKSSHGAVPNSFETPNPRKVKAGEEGATLLRIDMDKLVMLMEDDNQLSDSINSMAFAGMQEKLTEMVKQNQGAQTSPIAAISV